MRSASRQRLNEGRPPAVRVFFVLQHLSAWKAKRPRDEAGPRWMYTEETPPASSCIAPGSISLGAWLVCTIALCRPASARLVCPARTSQCGGGSAGSKYLWATGDPKPQGCAAARRLTARRRLPCFFRAVARGLTKDAQASIWLRRTDRAEQWRCREDESRSRPSQEAESQDNLVASRSGLPGSVSSSRCISSRHADRGYCHSRTASPAVSSPV